MAKTSVGTAHRHKTKSGYWSDKTDADSGSGHTHEYLDTPHAADILTAAEVTALKALLAAGGGGGTTPIPNPPPLPTPGPTISGVTISAITQTGATVAWNVSPAATGQVEYGTSINYGSTTTLESTPMTSHSQNITGLAPATLYHLRVRSVAGGILSLSSDRTFTTAPVSTPVNCTGTLQSKIDSALAGSTLTLTGCSFSAGATVNKALTIVGGRINVPVGGKGLIVTADDVTIDGVTFQGPQGVAYNANEVAVYVSASSAAKIDRLTVRNCIIDDFGYGGFYLRHTADLLLEDNTVRDVVYAGIMVLSCVTGTVDGNTVQRIGVVGAGSNSNNAYGIAVSHNESPRSSDVTVSGNTVEDVPTWEAMDTHGGLRITFDGNTVRRSRRGVMITGGVSGSVGEDCVVNDNDFLSPVSVPVNDQYAVVLIASVSADVTNNTITGWGTPSPEPRAYLRQGDTGTTISGNTVTP